MTLSARCEADSTVKDGAESVSRSFRRVLRREKKTVGNSPAYAAVRHLQHGIDEVFTELERKICRETMENPIFEW